jgi:hypothetical protein
MAETKPVRPETELIGEVGRYHVRRLKKPGGQQTLDVREYVRGGFEGYTRRGIALTIPGEVEQLRRLLDSIR